MQTKTLSQKLISTALAFLSAIAGQNLVCQTVHAVSVQPLPSSIIYCFYPSIASDAGNLDAITAQLPRVKNLGVSVVWLMPITPIGQPIPGHGAFGSPYCVHDYYSVNPAYGNGSDFKRLVVTAHRLGLKVILDEVLNHTSWDNQLITKHPEYYVHTDGNASDPNSVAMAFTYSDVAQLNYDNHDLWRYMDAMLDFWVTKYDVDGFRFDSADNPGGPNRKIPASFWQQAGNNLRQLKPGVIMLGECETPDLAQKPFNIDYGWDVYFGYKDALNGRGAQNIVAKWHRQNDRYSTTMLHMTIQDDWDMPCDLSVFGGVAGAKAAATFNFTINGVPLVYNGMEIGNSYPENTNPHSKIDWNHPNSSFAGFYHDLIALRSNNPALQQGKVTWLTNSSPDQVLTYTRSGEGEEFLAVINISDSPVAGSISMLDASAKYHDVWSAFPAKPGADVSKYNLAPHEYIVFKRDKALALGNKVIAANG